MKNTKGLIIGILIVIVLVVLIIMSGKRSAEQGALAPTDTSSNPATDTTVAPQDGTGVVPSTQNGGEQSPLQPTSAGDTGNTGAGQSSSEADLSELNSIDSDLQAIDVSSSSDPDLNSIDQETQ